jgi:hypothetical protein
VRSAAATRSTLDLHYDRTQVLGADATRIRPLRFRGEVAYTRPSDPNATDPMRRTPACSGWWASIERFENLNVNPQPFRDGCRTTMIPMALQSRRIRRHSQYGYRGQSPNQLRNDVRTASCGSTIHCRRGSAVVNMVRGDHVRPPTYTVSDHGAWRQRRGACDAQYAPWGPSGVFAGSVRVLRREVVNRGAGPGGLDSMLTR